MLNWKRILTLLFAFLCIGTFALSEDTGMPDRVLYQGGVVRRLIPRDDPNAELINVAYVRSDAAYPLVGEECRYSLSISGGKAPYQVSVVVLTQELGAQDNMFDFYQSVKVRDDLTFTVRFDSEVRYFFSVEITDQAGQYVLFQSLDFECFRKSAETDPQTVAGKVNQVIDEVIKPGMSDYSKAKALHDWLIYNATYDYNYENFNADGVLLKGTGVCESYTEAYQMLATAAGLECISVDGYGGIEPHIWNMVKLDGQWYHVDCTWDDPNAGGYERSTYFAVTDDFLAQTHTWNRDNTQPSAREDGVIAPETPVDPDPPATGADLNFSEAGEVIDWFRENIAKGVYPRSVSFMYVGSDEEYNRVANEYYDALYNFVFSNNANVFQCWSTSDGLFTAELRWFEQANNYLYIATDDLHLYMGETVEIIPDELYPEGSRVTWQSDDESIATVDRNGVITGVKAGTTAIHASVPSGDSHTIHITVREAHQPDWGLNLNKTAGGVCIAWNSIPGATNYRVMRKVGTTETQLAETSDLSVTLTKSQLPESEHCQIYVISERVIGDVVRVSFTSDPLEYGNVQITYSVYIPNGITSLQENAFHNTALGNVYLPDGLTGIGSFAFASCSNMHAIRIPESAGVGEGAFTDTPLQYAVITEDSRAHKWFTLNMPDVILIFE